MGKVRTIQKWEKHNNLVHGFTTKSLGNLSLRTGNSDDVANVRKIFASEFAIAKEDFLFLPLSHSNTILSLPKESILEKDLNEIYISGGHLFDKSYKTIAEDPTWQAGIDAIVTNKENVFPVILSADCAAIGFFCPSKSVIGFCHAGLIGAINQIAARTVHCMIKEYDCPPSEIETVIFPSIRKCHYNLKNSGAWEKIKDRTINFYGNTPDFIHGTMFDLQSLIVEQIKSEGISEKNIYDTDLCTICNNKWFFSNFAAGNAEAKKKEGRFANIIGIRKNKE